MPPKRKHTSLEDLLARVWCYYCERDFEDLAVLVTHQKAVHFKCGEHGCGKRLSTAHGLYVHVQNVHKKTIDRIENTIEGRDGIKPEIFGMEGVPEELIEEKRREIITGYKKKEAEHFAKTGNPLPGSAEAMERAAKKPKVLETKEELKARVLALKAQKQAEKEGKKVESGGQSAGTTPVNNGPGTAPRVDAPAQEALPHPSMQYPTSTYPSGTLPMSTLPTTTLPTSMFPTGTSPLPTTPMHNTAFPVPASYPPTLPPQTIHGPPPAAYGSGFVDPRQAGHMGYSPMGYSPLGGPPSAYPQPGFGASPVNGGHNSPPQVPLQRSTSTEPRKSSLPKIPGLPARPQFEVGDVSEETFIQLHHGLVPSGRMAQYHDLDPPPQPTNAAIPAALSNGTAAHDDIDALIANVTGQRAQIPLPSYPSRPVPVAQPPPLPQQNIGEAIATPAPAATTTAKTAKVSKASGSKARLVYSNNNISPEEARFFRKRQLVE